MAKKRISVVKRNKKKIAVVVSRFNDFITKRLLEACVDELHKNGIDKNDISIAWVPGAFEIPVAALKFAKKKSIHAVICLGAVIQGETPHFQYVCQGATQGITQAALLTGKPVIFGVLTTDTVQQASQRSEKKGYNKGRDCAQAALEMINLLSKI